MPHPLVVNIKLDRYDIYIGRGSPYGNPFIIGKDGNRDQVCDRYESLRSKDPEFIAMVKKNLRGKRLGCFCAPERCHGDWLAKIANED